MIRKLLQAWWEWFSRVNLLDEIVTWYRFRNRFYPYEQAVIEAIRSHLTPEGQAIMDAQLEKCTLIQRLPEGLELDIYPPGLAWEKVIQFPHCREEQLLAVVYLAASGQKRSLKVKVWLVRGHLFSFEFGTSPYLFFAGLPLAEHRPAIASVSMKCDPMLPEG